jgi:hypothetical protein
MIKTKPTSSLRILRNTASMSLEPTAVAPRALANTPALLHRFSKSAPLKPFVSAAAH